MILNFEDFKKVWTYKNKASLLQAEAVVKELNDVLLKYDIDSELRIQHFLAQTLHESAGFTRLVENLKYSKSSLLRVFPKYFKSESEAAAFAYKEEMIANRVYGNRLGNGPECSGEGFKYKGRGVIQLTGKSNYQKFSEWSSHPEIMIRPDLVSQPKLAVLSAVWFWSRNGLNTLADQNDIVKVTKRINGGTNGLQDRTDLLNKVKKYIRINL